MAKTRYGSEDPFRRYEEAAGIESPVTESPVATPLSGSVAAPYTGPRPWRGETAVPTMPMTPRKSLFNRAADFLSGRSALRSAMVPRSPVSETGGLLAAEPIVASSGVMPLSSIPRKSLPDRPTTFKPNTLYPLSSIPRNRLTDRSTMGSPPFTKKELAQGYRKVGKGK